MSSYTDEQLQQYIAEYEDRLAQAMQTDQRYTRNRQERIFAHAMLLNFKVELERRMNAA